MQPLHAVVKNGRLTLDEPSDLPDGQTVILLPLDELLTMAETGDVSFEVVSPPRQWSKPKVVDAAALLDELRSM